MEMLLRAARKFREKVQFEREKKTLEIFDNLMKIALPIFIT